MDIAAWLSGFVLFSLGVFHLSLWYIFRNRVHGYLGLGWAANISYIMLESKAEDGHIPPFLPFLASIFIIALFILAAQYLSPKNLAPLTTLVIFGYSASFLTLVLAWSSQNFMLGTAGGTVFSAAVYAYLAYVIWALPSDNFEILIRGTDTNLLKPNDLEAKGPLVDKFVDALQATAQDHARKGKPIIAAAFLAFGALQLAYPFKIQIKAISPYLWPSLFIIALTLKLSTAIGFSVLLRASATLVEAKIRRGSLAEELSKITVSVEHDMRAPLREMGLIIKTLKMKYQQDPFIQKEMRGLELLVMRIKAVMDLILSIRESPDDYRKRTDKINLASVLHKAVSAAKALHSGRDVSIKLAMPANAVNVYGFDERLTQVMTNLINNAVESRIEKYPDRMAVVDVRLRPHGSREQVEIEVQDDGVGIDPKKLRYVKEAYYSTKENSLNPNRGLGLFIADRIVGLHGGNLTIISELGTGTTARVILPWPKTIRRN
jgi:signal transduction histidine kinase